VCSLVFRFGGVRPLHNVLTLIFRSLMEGVPTVCFAISRSTVFLKVLLSALLLPRRNRSITPLFLMPLLHSCCAQRLLPSVSYLGTPPSWSLTNLSLARCRNGTEGHPSEGGAQILPGLTIALGPNLSGGALRLDTAPSVL
jgi:hypothetical protein